MTIGWLPCHRPIRPYSPRIVCTPGVVETEWKWGDLVCWGSVGQNGRIESLCYELCWHGRIQISLSSIGASSWHDDHKPELRSFWMFSLTKPPFEYNVAQIMHGFMVHFPSKKCRWVPPLVEIFHTSSAISAPWISWEADLKSTQYLRFDPHESCKLMIEKATNIVMICHMKSTETHMSYVFCRPVFFLYISGFSSG